MIGDWYAFRGHPYKCTASDIASIAECEEKGAPTDISEIPITPEILEKNTFESNKNLFGLCNYELSESYILENRGDRFCLSRIMAGHKYSTFWICDIHYVHELQHCLKLVGIEKEITL